MSRWHIKSRGWLMIQWGWTIFFSLGIHIDNQFRYVDLHLFFIIITIGDPQWSYEDYSNHHQAWWSSRNKS